MKKGRFFGAVNVAKGKDSYHFGNKEISMAMQPVTDLQVGKVCIQAKWPIRPELIPVSLA